MARAASKSRRSSFGATPLADEMWEALLDNVDVGLVLSIPGDGEPRRLRARRSAFDKHSLGLSSQEDEGAFALVPRMLAYDPVAQAFASRAKPAMETVFSAKVDLEPAAGESYYAGLIEDEISKPDLPKIAIGLVKWSDQRSTLSQDPERVPERLKVASIEIPPAKILAELWLARTRKGSDKPVFVLGLLVTAQPPSDQIVRIGMPMLRQTGNLRGEPLSGIAAKTGDQEFQFELSRAGNEHRANIQLLLGQPWIDIPVEFSSGRRATLTLRKGKLAGDLIDQALRAWQLL
jgi:hypothetical protein